jgi:predicted PurR-regulated permease PerM
MSVNKTVNKPRLARARPQPRDDIVQIAIRIGLLAFLIYWSFALVQPFIPILAWSMVLTVALYPVYHWVTDRLGGRSALAATLVTVVSLSVIVGPAAWLGFGLIDGLRALAEQVASATLVLPQPPDAVKEWPLIGERTFELWSLASSNVAGALAKIAPQVRPLAGPLFAAAGSAGAGIVKFLLSIIVMGFLFLPGPRLVGGIKMFLMHVVPERSDEFLALAGATIRAISRGVLGVSLLQSLLAGIGFKLAGVPGASILAFLVLFLGIVQIGGSLVILGSVVWAWFGLDTTLAVIFTAYMLPVSVIDNILKPMVMGHGLKTPSLVIFIGVLGGTLLHGIIGLFVGPIILAVGWELLMAWIREGVDLERAGGAPAGQSVESSGPR